MSTSEIIRRVAQFTFAISFSSLMLAAAPITQAQISKETVETTRNETIVGRAFDEWAKGGSVFGDLLAPDVKWTIHGSDPVAGTYMGLKDFVDRASAPLLSRLATRLVPTVHHIWAIGDTVIVRFDGAATTTSGAAYTNRFVWIFKMSNGVVTEAEAFLDLAAYRHVIDNNVPRAN